MEKVLIITPAFNEEGAIGGVIRDVRDVREKDIVVIDDGSGDKTGEIAKTAGAKVLTHVVNRGLGAALGTGFEYARRNRADVAVTFDADGQHKAKDIKNLIAPILANESDVVIGSRFLKIKGNMPLERKLLNYLANLLTYLLYGIGTTDSQSGLRAFNKKALNCITIKADRMEVSSEFFREIKRNNLRFAEVPIEAVYDEYSLAGSSQEAGAWWKMPWRMFLGLFR